MALLVAMVIAFALGLLLRYLLPHRATYGVLLTGGIAAAVAAVVWSILLLVDMTADQIGIWLISIAAGIVVAAVVPFITGKTRPKKDRALLESLAATKPV